MYGLRHQNILPLLAVIEEIPALLSGYSEHGDLRQFLRRRLRCDATNPDDPGFISDRLVSKSPFCSKAPSSNQSLIQ